MAVAMILCIELIGRYLRWLLRFRSRSPGAQAPAMLINVTGLNIPWQEKLLTEDRSGWGSGARVERFEAVGISAWSRWADADGSGGGEGFGDRGVMNSDPAAVPGGEHIFEAIVDIEQIGATQASGGLEVCINLRFGF